MRTAASTLITRGASALHDRLFPHVPDAMAGRVRMEQVQAILRLTRLLPDAGFDEATVAEFNRQTDFEFERIRDFIILHYKATTRDDTPFWRYVRDMDIPDTLQRKIDLWMANGRIFREDEELFAEESWIQVFLGQGVIPRGYDPLVRVHSDEAIAQHLSNIQTVIGKCLNVMPSHAEFVAHACQAPPLAAPPVPNL